MEAVFEEFESLLAEATEQAEAAVKAASPPPPTPTTRVSEYDDGWSETTDPSPDRDKDVDDLEPAAKRPRVTSSSLVGPSGVQTVFSDVGRRYKQGLAASSSPNSRAKSSESESSGPAGSRGPVARDPPPPPSPQRPARPPPGTARRGISIGRHPGDEQ